METLAQENAVLSQNQPILPEQPKQNNFLVVLLSILLLLSVSIAGFFAYQTQNLTNELSELKSNSISIPKATALADPKTSWKNFESKKYEFMFKYPSELILDSPSQTDSFEDSGELNLYTLPNGPVSFSLSVISSKGTTLDGQIDMVQNYGWSEYNKSNIDIDGVTGVMYSGVLDKKQPTRVVIFSNSKYIFKFSTVVFDDGEMLNQILSTFKFVESDPTANWKTYTNTSSNYQIKYPATWKIDNQSAGSMGTVVPDSRYIQIGYGDAASGILGIEEFQMIPPSEEANLSSTKTIGSVTLRCNGKFMTDTKTWCWVKVPNMDKYLNIQVFKNTDEEMNGLLDEILSTFKFTG